MPLPPLFRRIFRVTDFRADPRRLVSHSRGDVGYTAAIQFAPEPGFGWVILANREYAPLQNISHRVMGMIAHTP